MAAPADIWPPEKVRQLAEMWAAGYSMSRIADTLKVTKNSVAGKAHRLKLASRPSPIKRGGKAPKTLAIKSERPPLPVEQIRALNARGFGTKRIAKVLGVSRRAVTALGLPLVTKAAKRDSRPKPEPRVAVRARMPDQPAASGCQYPIGSPGTASFRYCGAPVLVGADVRPPYVYCAACRSVAYVRIAA